MAKQALKKLPQKALTKTIYYPIIKKIAATSDQSSNEEKLNLADEIIKFKSLLDEGVITEEEFNQIKKDLIHKSMKGN
ncbi:putative membrane protein [Clostridium pascui]|uniref:SHOCT domain-containing protein n=1 Tax=Clostridium pascui TaxID=46609 RepID=UPI001956C352|nr:SHOCT domain-containing protein [Clostridium pascui]MBM7872039.1 putative membrane protein [Clostridium pascui]